MKVSFRSGGLAAGAVIAAAAAVLFRDVLIGGEAFFGRDVTPFFYPMKHFLARSVQAGDFPFWNPWILNGVPFFGSLQPGHLYPGSLLFYVLPMPLAFNLVLVLHFPLAGLGVYLLLRRWELRRPAALFGGLAFMLGGFLVSTGNFYNNVQTAAWLPWLMLTWDRFLARGDSTDALWFALVAALAFLGGGADLLAVQLGLVLAFGLLAPPSGRRGDDRAPRSRQLLTFAAAGILALALVAVQLFPFWELVQRSVRTMSLELDYTAGRSLEPAALSQFLVPPALETGAHGFSARLLPTKSVPWLLSVYPGVLVLVFAGYGVADRSSRRWSLFWIGAAVVGVAFAMGRHSPVYRVLFEWVPPLRMVRYPEKFLAITALGIAVAGGRGFDRWFASPEDATKVVVPVLAALTAAAAGAAGVLAWRPEVVAAACGTVLEGSQVCGVPASEAAGAYASILVRTAGITAASATVAVAASRGSLSRQLAGGLLVLVLVADLGMAHDEVNPSVDDEIYRDRPWTSRTLTDLDPDRRSYRYRGTATAAQMGSALMVTGAWELTNIYLDYQNLGPNVGQIYRHLGQAGNQGVELGSVATMFTLAMNSPPEVRTRMMRAASVSYYADPTLTADSLPGLTAVAESPDLPIRIFEVEEPVPRAYLVSDYRTAPDAEAAYREALGGSFGLEESVVLTDGRTPPPLTGTDGSVVEARWRGDQIELRTETNGRMLLVVTDRHYPGWRASVNGRQTAIRRANGQYRAVVVPAGTNTVTMRYRPPHFRAGAGVSLIAALLWVGLFAFDRRR